MTLPARPENLGVVREALTGVAEGVGISDVALGDIKMAVTEACTNVILHAYDGQGSMEVEIEPEPGHLTIVVRDEGEGFKPRTVEETDRSTQRLGLPLIAALSDEFSV